MRTPGPDGQVERRENAARRPRAAVGGHGLQVDAHLDRRAGRCRRPRRVEPEVVQGSAVGDLQLQAHEIESRHRLRHRVLDLQARVRLDEGEAAVLADQKLDGAEAQVAHALAEAHGGCGQRLARLAAERRVGGGLDELLMAALHAASALAGVNDAARAVAENLHLDVPRARHQRLDVDRAVAEGGLRLRPAAFVGGVQCLVVVDGAHAAPAAAGHGLDHHRAVRGQQVARLRQRGAALASGRDRDAGVPRRGARPGLVAEQAQRFRRRADERQTGIGAGRREVRVLGKEAVAGVHRVAAMFARRGDDRGPVEIGGGARARERRRLVGHAHVERLAVVGAVDGDALRAEIGRRARDAHGDLAAVGDQQAGNRHGGVRRPREDGRRSNGSAGRPPRPLVSGTDSAATLGEPHPGVHAPA